MDKATVMKYHTTSRNSWNKSSYQK